MSEEKSSKQLALIKEQLDDIMVQLNLSWTTKKESVTLPEKIGLLQQNIWSLDSLAVQLEAYHNKNGISTDSQEIANNMQRYSITLSNTIHKLDPEHTHLLSHARQLMKQEVFPLIEELDSTEYITKPLHEKLTLLKDIQGVMETVEQDLQEYKKHHVIDDKTKGLFDTFLNLKMIVAQEMFPLAQQEKTMEQHLTTAGTHGITQRSENYRVGGEENSANGTPHGPRILLHTPKPPQAPQAPRLGIIEKKFTPTPLARPAALLPQTPRSTAQPSSSKPTQLPRIPAPPKEPPVSDKKIFGFHRNHGNKK